MSEKDRQEGQVPRAAVQGVWDSMPGSWLQHEPEELLAQVGAAHIQSMVARLCRSAHIASLRHPGLPFPRYIVYPPAQHHSFGALPGMFERTLTGGQGAAAVAKGSPCPALPAQRWSQHVRRTPKLGAYAVVLTNESLPPLLAQSPQ